MRRAPMIFPERGTIPLNSLPPKPIGILGLGTALPEKILTNKDLESLVDTTDEWIVTRTGIHERRILGESEKPIDIVLPAARRAIEESGLAPGDIDAVIHCTFTPDYALPSSACLVQGALGLKSGLAFDLNAACSGFVFGLQNGMALLRAGMARHVLVIGADFNSRVVDYTDRTTCVLFGDGAGAVVLGPVEEGHGILGNAAGADGASAMALTTLVGGCAHPVTRENFESKDRYMQMNGREVFKFAVRILGPAVDEALRRAECSLDEVDLLVPHQANIRIIDAAAARYGLAPERVVANVAKYGNTSAASIPLALDDARADGRLAPGRMVALVAFGAGLTYGASILRW